MNIIDKAISTQSTRSNVRAMIPVLIHWAKSGQTYHTYEDLANAIGKKRGTWIGHVLGCIQDVIETLSKQSGRNIPTLNALVNQKATGLPANGFEYVSKKYREMSPQDKRIYVDGLNKRTCDYLNWDWVLASLELSPFKPFTKNEISEILHVQPHYGGGEGEEHKNLKKYILSHPDILGISGVVKAETEYSLPSGDKLDVYFELSNGDKIAIEVKPSISDDADLIRGIFQCIKYGSILEAIRKVEAENYSIKIILLSNRALSSLHRHLIDTLSVKCVEINQFLNSQIYDQRQF